MSHDIASILEDVGFKPDDKQLFPMNEEFVYDISLHLTRFTNVDNKCKTELMFSEARTFINKLTLILGMQVQETSYVHYNWSIKFFFVRVLLKIMRNKCYTVFVFKSLNLFKSEKYIKANLKKLKC